MASKELSTDSKSSGPKHGNSQFENDTLGLESDIAI